MEEGLEKLWSRFSLTEEEQLDVVIEKEWVEDMVERSKNYLLDRLVMKKPVNLEAMKNIFMKVWKIQGGMNVNEVRERLFIFQFDDLLEKDRVLQKQPWFFNKSLLILKEINGDLNLKDVNMDWFSFTVQVHGLPLGLMIEKIGVVLGKFLGDIEEVETDDDKNA
ncbi:hypothetical protein CRYUN_Cryun36dG0046500 [Craigia yunnanensis]